MKVGPVVRLEIEVAEKLVDLIEAHAAAAAFVGLVDPKAAAGVALYDDLLFTLRARMAEARARNDNGEVPR